MDTALYPDDHLFPADTARRASTAKALVSIIEGCNHACTYCVVPTTRGPERHRPWPDVVAEVRGAVAAGFREVELLGQNVNSFQGGCSFAELLEWIRFTTSHPMNFTPALARTLASNPKVAPFLHLPVQSGSDTVLRRMHREYTVEQYLERLGYLGERSEDLCLSTDFIVGFPGETDADFQATLDLLERVRFDMSFSFIYSPRPGTPALRLQNDLPGPADRTDPGQQPADGGTHPAGPDRDRRPPGWRPLAGPHRQLEERAPAGPGRLPAAIPGTGAGPDHRRRAALPAGGTGLV
jgi:tRNA-2-methylthio-N6-dimethylallyladenosine synthase